MGREGESEGVEGKRRIEKARQKREKRVTRKNREREKSEGKERIEKEREKR